MAQRQVTIDFKVRIAWWAHVYLFIALLNVRLGIPVDAATVAKTFVRGVRVDVVR